MHATREQVARAVARDCGVRRGVEVLEEHEREESAMKGVIRVRKSMAEGVGYFVNISRK